MEKWKGWQYLRRFSLYPTKNTLVKFTSHLRFKPKGHRNRLWDLYKDMESCGEYEDIQVMWKMLQSSSSSSSLYGYKTKRSNRSSSSYLLLCFRPA